MVKLQHYKERYSITVPAIIVKQKGWKQGTELNFIYNERGNIEVTDSMKKKTIR